MAALSKTGSPVRFGVNGTRVQNTHDKPYNYKNPSLVILLAFLWQTLALRVCWAVRLSMGFVLDFDARNKILRVTLEGRLTDEILLGSYDAAAGYVVSHSPCRGIVDFSGVTIFEVSSDAMRKLAERAPAFPAANMRVLVAPRAHIYGMTRMFQILGESTRPNMHVVHTMEEAHRLLGLESPEFGPINLGKTG
jgi:hypothetical protein